MNCILHFGKTEAATEIADFKELAAFAERLSQLEAQPDKIELLPGTPVGETVPDITALMTPDQKERVYREVELEYRTEDAINHIYGYFGYDPDMPEDSIANQEAVEYCAERYDANLLRLADRNCEESLVTAMIDKFNDIFDCNIAENDLWEEAVSMVLERKFGT